MADQERWRLNSFFGRVKKINIKGPRGEIIREITGPDDFLDFISNRENRRNIAHYQHEVIPKNVSRRENIESATKGYRKLVKMKTGKTVPVTHGGEARERFGITLMEPKTARSRLLREVDEMKEDIIDRIPNDQLLEIAKRKNAERYYSILENNELGEYNSNAEKAEAIRSYIRNRRMTASPATSPDGYASSIVWEAGKNLGMVSRETRFGSNAYDDIDKVLRRDKSTELGAKILIKKDIRSRLGPKGSPQRRIFEEIKQSEGLTDLEALRYVNTPQGKQDFLNRVLTKTREGRLHKSTARSIQNKMNLPGGDLVFKEIETPVYRNERQQKTVIGRILDYKSSAEQRVAVKLLHRKMSQDPDAVKALQKGTDDEIREKLPKSVSYHELRDVKGGDVNASVIKHLRKAGVEVTDLPPDIEAKATGEYYKPTGKTPREKTIRYTAPKSRVAPGGGLLFGSKKVSYIGGKPVWVKTPGRIQTALAGIGGKIKSRITPGRRDKEKIYRELKEREDLRYLTDEEKRYAAYASPVTRRQIIQRGRRMYYDEAYRAKQLAKKERRRGFYQAKLEKAMIESERRHKAAVSPWWRAWYGLTHNTKILVGVALIVSLLFLPIGLFHVLGWAIAVGVVRLVMFVIWVFVELWWLIAQGLVGIINLIGQAITSVFNWIGSSFTNAVGQSFTPFKHILVQNVKLVDIVDGKRTILGITWGEWNLVPPSFLKLDSFMPRTFDTDVLIAKIWPALSGFFKWYTQPIADRYTEWISQAEWYHVGAAIGIPIVIMIILAAAAILHIRRKLI